MGDQPVLACRRGDAVWPCAGQLLVSVLGGRCQTPEVTCFLLDDRGYMISHPEHVSPWREGPVEQQHVSSKEPLLANHILSQQRFVSKKQCNRRVALYCLSDRVRVLLLSV